VRALYAALAVLLTCALVAAALAVDEGAVANDADVHLLDLRFQWNMLLQALVRLPLAGVLGAALAFRPHRSGTPARTPSVIQTQVLLALIGALVMLVVGGSLARAFGIVGVASLIRYRARISDPKDAGVMLAVLGIGLASGVGLYALAVVATLLILATLWVLESLGPEEHRVFELTVVSKSKAIAQAEIEALLRRQKIEFELRSSSDKELSYAVRLPADGNTDRLSSEILSRTAAAAVEWQRKRREEE